jgi:DedD protein
MALSSLFKRKAQADSEAPKTAATSVDGVQKIRVRTRQRLIGAVVLVTLGVIGFPLLFESQPRPIPVDIPIEVPAQDNSPALVLPAPKPDSAKAPLAPSVAADETVIETAPAKEIPSAAVASPVPASKPAEAASAAASPKCTPACTSTGTPRPT